MKEVIVVSKAHLDLGFTDFASSVKEKYLREFIPSAIDLAGKLNEDGEKKFVWTLGSWLVKEALESEDEILREKVTQALKNGDLVAHAMPFTTHTELLDEDLLDYGLRIVDRLDRISGRKTIAAKMTDVPGHTVALVPALAKHGIKLLHIGVNGAAALPDVEPCFVWKYGDAEVVVIYDKGYGGVFEVPYTDQILYFDHAHDNGGVRRQNKVLSKLKRIQSQYPGYEVRAGRLDDIAEKLWEVKDKLPVLEGEIGDTWIHGVATDPYKTAAFRTLCNLKNKWLREGSLRKDSDEYKRFADSLLCVAEHTWGLDMKTHIADMENYRKDKFVQARQRDLLKIKRPLGALPYSFLCWADNTFGKKSFAYSAMQKSWSEQRGYVDDAVNALDQSRAREARLLLEQLRPVQLPAVESGKKYEFGEETELGEFRLAINEKGGIMLRRRGVKILDAQDRGILTYRSYGYDDYEYWRNHYMRSNVAWARYDYLRPLLKKQNDYPRGLFEYRATNAIVQKQDNEVIISLDMKCDEVLCNELGAPSKVVVVYRLSGDGLKVQLAWSDKDAVRTTESIATHFYPTSQEISYVKIGKKVDPRSVVSKGGRKLSVIEHAEFCVDGDTYELGSIQAALVASDGGNILHFDDEQADILEKGLSYVLCDNVWGTNFPLWYEENAYFEFAIAAKDNG
ncbi:MAG: DUF5054 domain-containing protein [Christensenellales bacterium]